MSSDPELLRALLRQDFGCFLAKVFSTLCPSELYIPEWYIECLTWHLSQVVQGKRLRLIINLPPRSLKSMAGSIALPAFLLGHNPSQRIICVSYSDELARKHSRDTRSILEARWYRQTFPQTRINPRKNTEGEIETTAHGFRLATSTGGTLTGRGGQTIIIDDPIKPMDAESETERKRVNAWYDNTLYSRLDNKREGAIIVIMQRLHQDDLTGYLVEKGGFEVIAFPAIAMEYQSIPIGPDRVHERMAGDVLSPERESLEDLQDIKQAVGSRTFNAQYQQAPLPAEGNLFKAAWIRRYDGEAKPSFGEIVQSWDTATKLGTDNDYSVGTTWGICKNDYYLLDVCRGRWEFPNLQRAVIAEAERHQVKTLLIEDASSGAALIQTLRQQTRLNIINTKPKFDKMTRANQQSAAFESGRVFLPKKAAWLDEFENELLAFPNGRYDDQVDSTVQFLNWAMTRWQTQAPIVAPIIIPLASPTARWDNRQ